MFIADTINSRIRQVTFTTGVISTVAGTGTNSYTGDGGAATSATLYYPSGVAVDSAGSVNMQSLVLTSILTTLSSRQRVHRW